MARIVDAFPYVFPYLVGAISVWASPNQQRLGDRWANTVVVTKESIALPSGGVPGPAAAGGWQHVPAPPPVDVSSNVESVPPLPPPPPMPPGTTT